MIWKVTTGVLGLGLCLEHGFPWYGYVILVLLALVFALVSTLAQACRWP